MIYALFYFLFALGDVILVNFVGEISITGIFLIVAFAVMLLSGRVASLIKRDRNIAYVTKLYLWLLAIQMFTELCVGNLWESSMKGLAVTLLSYMKFIFLWSIISKHPRHIIWIFLWSSIVSIVYLDAEEVDVKEVAAGSGAALSVFKMQVVPLIGRILILLSIVFYRHLTMSFWFILTGLCCIVLGARSSGLIIALTGLIAIFYHTKKKLSKSIVVIGCMFAALISYGLYVYYVDAVLSGEIVGGNSSFQLRRASNPYNPFSLLMMGRTETPAEMAAIMDSPWIGWGAWPKDPGMKYHQIAAETLGLSTNYSGASANIPGHSVIFQSGVNNGIFAMFVMVAILWFFLKRGYLSLNKKNPYFYLVIFCMMQLIWNGFFSPLNHFRGWFPIYFVCCLMSYEHLYEGKTPIRKPLYGK
jgi:hypothetical protein